MDTTLTASGDIGREKGKDNDDDVSVIVIDNVKDNDDDVSVIVIDDTDEEDTDDEIDNIGNLTRVRDKEAETSGVHLTTHRIYRDALDVHMPKGSNKERISFTKELARHGCTNGEIDLASNYNDSTSKQLSPYFKWSTNLSLAVAVGSISRRKLINRIKAKYQRDRKKDSNVPKPKLYMEKPPKFQHIQPGMKVLVLEGRTDTPYEATFGGYIAATDVAYVKFHSRPTHGYQAVNPERIFDPINEKLPSRKRGIDRYDPSKYGDRSGNQSIMGTDLAMVPPVTFLHRVKPSKKMKARNKRDDELRLDLFEYVYSKGHDTQDLNKLDNCWFCTFEIETGEKIYSTRCLCMKPLHVHCADDLLKEHLTSDKRDEEFECGSCRKSIYWRNRPEVKVMMDKKWLEERKVI